MKKRSKIELSNMQIKSIEKAKRLAYALQIIEEECGIHEVEISIDNIFICPWISLGQLQDTDMEKLLAEIIVKA